MDKVSKLAARTSSPRQIAANRRNAKKSTGPRTPAGKARVGKNHVKHGLLSRSAVLRCGPLRENVADFQRMHDRLRKELDPCTEVEELLVDRIAALYWRLLRAQRYESGALHHAAETHEDDDSPAAGAQRQAEFDLDQLEKHIARVEAAAEHLKTTPDFDSRESFLRISPAIVDWQGRRLHEIVAAPSPQKAHAQWLEALKKIPERGEDLRAIFLGIAADRLAKLQQERKEIENRVASAIAAQHEEHKRRRALQHLPEEPDLRRLVRYESMLDRELNRALNQLRKMQKTARSRDTRSSRNDGKNKVSDP